jgi:D-alanyl-D-alanine carboxypeptidase (penicillin-binding protein 5/6)
MRKVGGIFLLVVLLVIAYAAWALSRPMPRVSAVINATRSIPVATTSSLIWPSVGQSAVGVLGTPILDTHGAQKPVPTASTAKLITALNVLRDKPLKVGQQGPSITLSQGDVNIYNMYSAKQGSVVQVQAGEKISEYQMLECMLLPSANNMADSLAIWAYGSLSAYSGLANGYVHLLGLSQTHVGIDASGFDPTTVSSAHDLVRIGELAMDNPVIKSIVSQKSASGIPVVNNIKSVNSLLGTNNVVGIKTGNTDQAGGVFISAATIDVASKPTTLVTALTAVPGLWQAMNDSVPLITSAQSNFKSVSLVNKGDIIGEYNPSWDHSVSQAIAAGNLRDMVWGGTRAELNPIKLNKVAYPSSQGQVVGSLTANNEGLASPVSVNVTLGSSLTKPSVWWRLTHP